MVKIYYRKFSYVLLRGGSYKLDRILNISLVWVAHPKKENGTLAGEFLFGNWNAKLRQKGSDICCECGLAAR